MKSRLIVKRPWVLAALLLVVACGGPGGTERAERAGDDRKGLLRVHVVNYPLQYFAERIGGERVRVEFPAPPGVDPAFWRPAAEDVVGFQHADLVLLNGAGYAGWLDSVSLVSSSLVDTSAAVRDRYIRLKDVETHSHGPEGEHEHGDLAFTTWLDLSLAVEQGRAIEKAFSVALPAGVDDFRAGREKLEADLMALDRELRETVDGRDVPLLGSHPVYQYLAAGYGLHIESVHFEPDEEPGEAAWMELRDLLARHPARWMLWEGEPLEITATRLREMGVASVVFDPCGNRPEDGDFLEVQRANLENLRQVFGPGS